MDTLRWILLALGLLLIAAVWLDGMRRQPAHTEGLLQRLRQRWRSRGGQRRRRRGTESAADPAEVDLQGRDGPDLGLDDDELAALDGLIDAERGPAARGRDTAAATDGAGPADEPAATPAPESPAAREAAIPARPAVGQAEPDTSTVQADVDDDATPGEAERIVVLYVVAPPGEHFHGDELAAAFGQLGLEFGEMDLFHRRDEAERTLFSVANATSSGTFDAEAMAEMDTRGVALFARLPGPHSPTATFDELARAARALANLLGGRALDERQSTLTRQTEQAMRDELREYEHRRARARR